MVSVAKAWSRRPPASGLELGASGSAVQPLDLGSQGQGLPELEEFLCLFVISAQVEKGDPRPLSGNEDICNVSCLFTVDTFIQEGFLHRSPVSTVN
jgi:hypothetical protein